jgi:methylmalonyl-CoA/ethylmalonyl-CoA epimerase
VRISRINHLGVLVRDLDAALAGFRDLLGLPLERTERYGEELDIAFLPCGESDVELITPLVSEGRNHEWLERHGPAIQHVAFEVEDLGATLAELAKRGVEPLGEAPRAGAGNTLVAFLEPELFGGILVELCQPLES